MIATKIYSVLLVLITISWLTAGSEPRSKTAKKPKTSFGKIILGHPAHQHQFPYIVSMQKNGWHFCGAVIISQIWLVSAGHCFEESEYRHDIFAVAGILKLDTSDSNTQRVPVEHVIVHPHYYYRWNQDEKVLRNDLALLQLRHRLHLNHAVKKITLPSDHQQFYGSTTLSGWGFTNYSKGQVANHLQFVSMDIIDIYDCVRVFRELNIVTFSLYPKLMTCGQPLKLGQDSCHGDSGGPLVKEGILVGITSFGIPKCSEGLKHGIAPTVFTSVSYYKHFIHEHVKHHKKHRW